MSQPYNNQYFLIRQLFAYQSKTVECVNQRQVPSQMVENIVRERRPAANVTLNVKKGGEIENVNYEFEPIEVVKSKRDKKTNLSHGFLTHTDFQCLIFLSIAAIIVRFAFLNHPSVVIFDEVHFGGFAQKYLKGEFFFDLHPPLARLLVTLSAWIGRFDANFSFYGIGADYLKPGVPYVVMRGFCALAGVLIIPIGFVTMRGMEISLHTAATVATMLIFENALITQSRLILLDAYLIIFTSLVGLTWIFFRQSQSFTSSWYLSLLGVGISMALSASCKWVGLFAVVAVGLYTISDMWNMLGDVKVPLKVLGKHLIARAIALIVVPFVIYMSLFWIHFALLKNYSEAAAGFPLEFQQGLRGGELPSAPADVYFGAEVRIRQYRSHGPFLHSHAHNYPTGSKQQQITGYHHRDQNNLWIIRRAYELNVTYHDDRPDEREELVPLRHNDVLRLEHLPTGRFLHSHNNPPPISDKEKQFEVSGYAHHPTKFSDLNDNWRIEIVDDKGESITKEQDEEGLSDYKPSVLAINTKFRLVHTMAACILHCRGKSLPQWGYGQNEVTCGRETLLTNQIWIIESNSHPKLDVSKTQMMTLKSSGFWSNFVEMNKRMWQSNAGLSSDHPFGSRPDSWPLLKRGCGFWNGNHVPKTERQFQKEKKKEEKKELQEGIDKDELESDQATIKEDDPEEIEDQKEQARLTEEYQKFKGQQIYLLGNPVIWWSSTLAIILYVLLMVCARISKKKSTRLAKYFANGTSLGSLTSIMSYAGFLFIQWVWHFLPFFGMKRQLFLHHYLPALYFATLLFACLLDTFIKIAYTSLKLTDQNQRRFKMCMLGLYAAVCLWVFYKLAPLSYGLAMSKSQCESIRWLNRWDFDCNSLPDTANAVVVT